MAQPDAGWAWLSRLADSNAQPSIASVIWMSFALDARLATYRMGSIAVGRFQEATLGLRKTSLSLFIEVCVLRKLLVLGRYLLVVPVIGSLLLTVGVVIMSAGLMLDRAWNLLSRGEFTAKAAKLMSMTVIETIDFFLVGALGYITAIGIYSLFITADDEQLLKRIKIEKLTDLEDKIIGVVVAALAVSFLGSVTHAENMQDIFYAGSGSALVVSSLCLFMYLSSKSK